MCACAIWSIQLCHKVGGTSVRMGFRTNWVSKWTLHHFTQLYCTNLPALNKHIPVVPSSLGLVWGVRAFGSSCSQLVLQPPECWPMPAIGPCTWPQSICSSSGLGCRCWGQVRPAVAGMVEVTLSLVWLLWIGCSRIAAEATECCVLGAGLGEEGMLPAAVEADYCTTRVPLVAWFRYGLVVSTCSATELTLW